MNGKQLGFATHLGHHWKPWQAYRELWSNNKDENGVVSATDRNDMDSKPALMPKTKHTTIVVNCPEIENVHLDRHTVVLPPIEAYQVLTGVEVFAGKSKFLFYRGIRVHELVKESMFTYNLTATQFLTEDRTLTYPHVLPTVLARAIISSTYRPFLHAVLSSDDIKETFESSFAYSSVESEKPSPQFMEVAEQLLGQKKLSSAAMKLFKHYQDTMPGYVSPYLVHLTALEQGVVDMAKDQIRTALKNPDCFRNIDVLFKSRTEVNKLSVSKRTITLDHRVISEGANRVARYLLEGLAVTHGGGIVEQLSSVILTGRFVDEELTRELDTLNGEIPF